MAKKILAVVMAVLIAVSAMAITAFADTQVTLYRVSQYKEVTGTLTFDIPVYGFYGYLTAGDYMIVDLPTNWEGNCPAAETKWSVQVNGMSFALPTFANSAAWGSCETEQVKISLAYLAHDYDGNDTAIPQSIAYNGISSIRLVASMTIKNSDGAWRISNLTGLFNKNGGLYATAAKAQWYKADGTPVNGSVSYAYSWNAAAEGSDNATDNVFNFVTEEWTTGNQALSSYPFTWDHTLANRAALTTAESVELVVELNKEIVGKADYTLYANLGNASNEEAGLWWNYSNSRKYVDTVSVDGATDKLTFKVPMDVIYNSTYGTYNSQFVIFENITLLNTTIMTDYLHVNKDAVGDSGSLGRLSWVGQYSGQPNHTVIRYDGKQVNYAASGKAGKDGNGFDTLEVTGLVPANFAAYAGGANTYETVNTGITVQNGATIAIAVPATDCSMVSAQVGGIDLWGDGWNKNRTKTFTYEELKALGANDGDEIVIIANNWQGNAYDAFTVKVSANTLVNTKLTGDVYAKAVYLNAKTAEVEPEATPDTPTESGDNAEDVEGGEEVTVDDTPAPAPEKNPTTGVALAVVPMLVAAAAAVIAKKH